MRKASLFLSASLAFACLPRDSATREDAGSAADAGSPPCAAFDAGALDPTLVAQGTSLVRQFRCQQCHGGALQGNAAGVVVPHTTSFRYPPNLTPDPATGLGCWSDDEIANAILNSVDNEGSRLCGPMPHFASVGLTEPQVRSIVAFLRSLPAISNPNIPSGDPCSCTLDAECPPGESCIGGGCTCESLACSFGELDGGTGGSARRLDPRPPPW
jgi:hypothetical protein